MAAFTLVTVVILWVGAGSKRVMGVPRCAGGVIALRVEPPACGRRLAPDGRPSLTRARRHPPRSLARRVAPDCGLWPCRVARQCGDQGCAFIARHNSRVRPAAPAVPRQRPVPVPGDRGLGFLHAARERRPLDELAGVPLTPLRSVRCTPARSSPRSPATPDAGPLNASVCLRLLDRRASRLPSVHGLAACAPVVPPRSPIKPASTADGDLWWENRCAWPGIWLTALAGENPTG